MTTGERIKHIRKSQGMNQTEFAKAIAVSTTTICQLETGRYNISRTTKHVLCNQFHINPVWLDTGEGEMYSTGDTPESIVPELVQILSDNPAILNAVRLATQHFSVEEWQKLNAFIQTLGGE